MQFLQVSVVDCMKHNCYIYSKYLVFQIKDLVFQSKYLALRSKTLDFDQNIEILGFLTP